MPCKQQGCSTDTPLVGKVWRKEVVPKWPIVVILGRFQAENPCQDYQIRSGSESETGLMKRFLAPQEMESLYRKQTEKTAHPNGE